MKWDRSAAIGVLLVAQALPGCSANDPDEAPMSDGDEADDDEASDADGGEPAAGDDTGAGDDDDDDRNDAGRGPTDGLDAGVNDGDEASPSGDGGLLDTAGGAIEDALSTTRPPGGSETALSYLCLDLKLDADGTVQLLRQRLVETTVIPMPSLAAPFMVTVTAEGGEIVSATPLQFVTAGHTTMQDENGEPLHEATVVEAPLATTCIPAPAESEQVEIDALVEGEVDARLVLSGGDLQQPESFFSPTAARSGQPLDFSLEAEPDIGFRALTRPQLEARFPEIEFLKPGEEELMEPELLYGGTIREPTAAQAQTLADSLDLLTPQMRNAARKIAIVRMPDDGRVQRDNGTVQILGAALGNALMINEFRFGQPGGVANTVTHEVTHNFVNLLDAATSGTIYTADWTGGAASLAFELVRRYRLGAGLGTVWRELHECGVEAGYAGPYVGDGAQPNTAAANQSGFATSYGATQPGEDIAEYVGTLLAPTSDGPGVCPNFSGVSELTPELSIRYAKLALLLALGMIEEPTFNACVQGAQFSNAPRGIDFPGSILFDTALQAGYTEQDGLTSFNLLGRGPSSYHVLFEMVLPSGSDSPLGMHRLDAIGLFNVGDVGLSGAYLAHDDDDRARAGERGLVLITEASAERTRGVIFGLVLQNALGLNTDYMPFGTFNID